MKKKSNYDLIMAASQDAGNCHMRENCRTSWNRDDWNAAAKVADELFSRVLADFHNGLMARSEREKHRL
jgi:hypothetical protein